MQTFFKRGLAALLPVLLTVMIFYFVISFLFSTVGVPLGDTLYWLLLQSGLMTSEPGTPTPPYFPTIGFVTALLLTFVLGFFAAGFIGRKMIKLFDYLLGHVPMIRVVYPYAKQFTNFLLPAQEQKKLEFKNAVAVPFPSPGIYSIGFITSEGLRSIDDAVGKHLVSVFIPAAPTPFSGFVLFVPREDVIPLPISGDEAIRLILSVGVLTPPHQTTRMAVATGPVASAAPQP